jgi:glutamyl-tRNA reductase
MTLIALGINHKTAKLDVREKVAFSPEQLPVALQELIGLPALKEAALLSTCNRTELYLHINDDEVSQILSWLKKHKALKDEDILDCHYIHKNEKAVAHMMNVACGLDSMVLGESQVLGQLKQAFSVARSAGTIGTHLEQLFQHSFSVAKTVRTETDIGVSAVSVAYASVTLAKQLFSTLENTTALFIGAGETIELAAQHFTSQAKINTIFANRTRERASELAERFNGEAISLSEISNYLSKADIVISATASPLPILGKGLVESAIKQRKRKPIFMIDLAVPRDVEAEVRELPDIYLFDVDALQNIIQENIKGREKAAVEAKIIIEKQTQRFLDWRRSLGAVSTIRNIRDKYQDMADIELSRSLSKLEKGESAENLLRELTRRLTNKFLHEPTRQLNDAVSQGDTESLNRARNLFSLDKEPSKSNQDKQK